MLLFIGSFVAFFGTGIMPVCKVYIAEQYPTELRGVGTGFGEAVSRVGGAAQTRAIKKTAGTLRIDLARFRELEVFTQFASDLDPAPQQALDHGRRLLELLKQPLYHPMPVSRQAILLYVATSGLVDDVPLEHVRPFVLGFADEMEAERPDMVAEIESTGTLSGPAVECIRAALADAKKRGSATWQA